MRTEPRAGTRRWLYGVCMEPVYSPVIGAARLLFAAQGLRFNVTGIEHVPREGGAVLVINHIGYLDFALAGMACLPTARKVRFMAKSEVFDSPVSGPLMRGMHHIPVDRDAGATSFRTALKALKGGEIVGVFPEATISRSFEIKAFKSGAVRMAQAARVPLVPLVLWGSQRVWTKGHPKRLGRTRTPIAIDIGAPLKPAHAEDAEAVCADLRARMQQMLIAVQRAYPPVPVAERALVPARLGGTAPTLDQAEAMDAAESAARATRRPSPHEGTATR